jgi:H+/Cl- antiporter ClcA
VLAGQAYPTTVIVLCMVGFLAAATQAPITSFIIVMEMVNGYPLVIDMMATALIASAVSRMVSRPLYATLADHMVEQQRKPPMAPITAVTATPPSSPPEKA